MTLRLIASVCLLSIVVGPLPAAAAPLRAGAAKVDVTHPDAPAPGGPLYAKALVLSDGVTTAVVATVDAVAIGEIGPVKTGYLAAVREALEQQLQIPPSNVLVNASHCHGKVCEEVAERTVEAVREAARSMVAVRVGAGVGREDRISENRRLKLASGRESDVRHAYSLPPDEEVVDVGPIDPSIGVLRLDRLDGRPLALVYHFACHPIQGIPSGQNTADITGFASKLIEDQLGDGAIALFLQGCAGDINPVLYKDLAHPRDAEPLGNLLGLSTMTAAREIRPAADAPLRIVSHQIELPRADLAKRIERLEAEQQALVQSLRGTTLNLKTFVPLYVKYQLSSEYPSYDSHRYLHDRRLGRDDWSRLDAENRKKIEQYVRNVHVMEELTRLQVNLRLLTKHHARNQAAGTSSIEVEVLGLRVGDFYLVTFPGELTVEIGLGIKKRSPHPMTFVSGYTNGYIYYAPTAANLGNPGGAQEDSDCLLAPEWQAIYEDLATGILNSLSR